MEACKLVSLCGEAKFLENSQRAASHTGIEVSKVKIVVRYRELVSELKAFPVCRGATSTWAASGQRPRSPLAARKPENTRLRAKGKAHAHTHTLQPGACLKAERQLQHVGNRHYTGTDFVLSVME